MTDYLLAPSILAADFANLGEALRQAEAAGADWIHVDVMDGHFVPNLTMGPVVVKACRRVTELPLDIHLMVTAPERLLEAFADAGADSLTVHVEATYHLHRTLTAIHDLGLRAGVALNPGTPALAVSEVLHLADLLLVMTVNPGYAGQAFLPEVLPKVETLARWRRERNLRARLQVDGGITPETAPLAARAGADVFVAASAIFGHPQGIVAGVRALREALQPATAA